MGEIGAHKKSMYATLKGEKWQANKRLTFIRNSLRGRKPQRLLQAGRQQGDMPDKKSKSGLLFSTDVPVAKVQEYYVDWILPQNFGLFVCLFVCLF